MVARINVSVEFHYTGMSASLCHRAYTGLLTHPVGQGRIEYLHIVFADIFFHPFVKESTEEVPPLFRSDWKVSQCSGFIFGKRSEMTSVFMWKNTFNDRSELDILATDLFEETIKLQRIFGIEVIDNCHCIPFYPVFLQKIDALHHFHKRRFSQFVFAILVMKLLGTVDGDTYQPIVFTEEFAPFVSKHGSVGLDAIVDRTSAGVFLL